MLVSVIIPAYNATSTISETIDSIIRQSHDKWEAIVIDDGSTDNLELFLKYYTDPRIKYFYKKNGGVASARNYGLSMAQGNLIAFLDSDDIWHTNKLSESIKQIKTTNADLVFSDILMFDSDINHSFEYKYTEPFDIENDHERLLVYDYIPTLTVVVKKSVLEDVGYFDETLFGTEDWDLWIRISKYYKISYLKMSLSYYRNSSTGLSKSSRDRHLLEEWKVIGKHIYNNDVDWIIRRKSLWVWNRKVFYNHIKLGRYFKGFISYCRMISLIPLKRQNLFFN